MEYKCVGLVCDFLLVLLLYVVRMVKVMFWEVYYVDYEKILILVKENV